IPCFAVGEPRSGIMAGWRRAVELAMTGEEIERLTALSRARTERRAGYRGRRYCWPIARILRSVRWGKELGFTIKRFSAAWSGRWAMGRWRRSRIGLRPGQRTGHPAGGQSLVGVAGVRQGQGHGYLLRGATGSARGDIVREIIEIVRQVASGLPSEQPNPLDYG